MVTDLVLAFFKTLFNWAAALLPSWDSLDIVTPINDAFDAIGPQLQIVGWANNYVPIAEGLGLLLVLGGLWLAAHLYTLAIWVLSKLHILGGGST